MKKLITCIAFALAAPVAYAQTCAAPAAFQEPNASVSGTTCGAEDSVSLYCGAQPSVAKPERIYRTTLAAAGPLRTATAITITGAGAGFTPTIYLYSGSCITGDGCVQTGEAGVPMDLTTVGAGTYFLSATASPIDADNACGTYTVSTTGTLPVALKQFSVE